MQTEQSFGLSGFHLSSGSSAPAAGQAPPASRFIAVPILASLRTAAHTNAEMKDGSRLAAAHKEIRRALIMARTLALACSTCPSARPVNQPLMLRKWQNNVVQHKV